MKKVIIIDKQTTAAQTELNRKNLFNVSGLLLLIGKTS